MIERAIAALTAARDRHPSEALRSGAKDGVDPAYTFGYAVGFQAGLNHALQLVSRTLAENESKDKLS